VYTAHGLIEGGINITEGRISKIAPDKNLDKSEIIIDAGKKLILPGLIDVHVHLRDLNQTDKETFRTGTEAAARGGVTTVLDMPNNKPPITTLTLFNKKLEKAEKQIIVNTGFYSGLPKTLTEIKSIVEAGAFGFKIYLNNPITELDILDTEVLRKTVKEIAQHNSRILIHAELLNKEEKADTSLSEEDSIKKFLKKHSKNVEINAVKYVLTAINDTPIKAHFCHMTTCEAINLISQRKTNAFLSIEVTPHHLFLDSSYLFKKKSYAKTVPPLREKSEVEKIWYTAIESRKADIIATDHAPHTQKEKNKEFINAASGIPGLETMLPLLLTEYIRGRLTLERLVELTAITPARIMGIKKRGKIQEGYYADLVIVDLGQEYVIRGEEFLSKAKITPFEGFKVKGIVEKTFVNGRVVYDRETGIVDESSGRILRSNI